MESRLFRSTYWLQIELVLANSRQGKRNFERLPSVIAYWKSNTTCDPENMEPSIFGSTSAQSPAFSESVAGAFSHDLSDTKHPIRPSHKVFIKSCQTVKTGGPFFITALVLLHNGFLQHEH